MQVGDLVKHASVNSLGFGVIVEYDDTFIKVAWQGYPYPLRETLMMLEPVE